MYNDLMKWNGRITIVRFLPIVAAAILAATLSGTAGAQPGALKIGVFDAQRISEETEEGKRIQTELETFRDRKQAEVTAKESALVELQNQLETQALSLSNDRRVALEREIQRKLLDLNTFRESAAQEMQLEVAEAQERFQEQLIMVINDYGRAEDFDLILEIGTVVYFSSGIDVTTAIVDRFDAMVRPAAPDAGAGGN